MHKVSGTGSRRGGKGAVARHVVGGAVGENGPKIRPRSGSLDGDEWCRHGNHAAGKG